MTARSSERAATPLRQPLPESRMLASWFPHEVTSEVEVKRDLTVDCHRCGCHCWRKEAPTGGAGGFSTVASLKVAGPLTHCSRAAGFAAGRWRPYRTSTADWCGGCCCHQPGIEVGAAVFSDDASKIVMWCQPPWQRSALRYWKS